MAAVALMAELHLQALARGQAGQAQHADAVALKHLVVVCGIGEGLKTKVNANIGTSQGSSRIAVELKKLKISVDNGADAVMDLSTAGDLRAIRKAILRASPVPVGTVPIYEAVVAADRKKRPIPSITAEDMLAVLEEQAREGVDFFTIHSGVTRKAVDCLKKQGRVIGVVSRGGAIIVEWMAHNRRENPFYEEFDRVLEIAHKYDVTLSLGDGMRPGCLADASDRAQRKQAERSAACPSSRSTRAMATPKSRASPPQRAE